MLAKGGLVWRAGWCELVWWRRRDGIALQRTASVHVGQQHEHGEDQDDRLKDSNQWNGIIFTVGQEGVVCVSVCVKAGLGAQTVQVCRKPLKWQSHSKG